MRGVGPRQLDGCWRLVDWRRPQRYERGMSRTALQDLIERARSVEMTPDQKESQRRSFAFGNTRIENEQITRETVDRAAAELETKKP